MWEMVYLDAHAHRQTNLALSDSLAHTQTQSPVIYFGL